MKVRHVLKHLKQNGFITLLFCLSLVCCLWLGQTTITVGQIHRAPPTDVKLLMQQGLDHYQQGNVTASIQVWRTILQQPPALMTAVERVTVQKYLARAYAQVGQFGSAIALFSQLQQHYQQAGDMLQVGRMMTEQAQLYDNLGQHQKAIALLCGEPNRASAGVQNNQPPACHANSAVAIAHHTSDQSGKVAALGSLGNTYRLQGEYDRALQYLTSSLDLAQTTGNSTHPLAIYNTLGTTYASLANREYRRQQFAAQSGDISAASRFQQQAIAFDQQAIQAFHNSLHRSQQRGDRINQLRSLLNLVVPLHRSQTSQSSSNPPQQQSIRLHSNIDFSDKLKTSQDTLQQAKLLLPGLPDSREKVYAMIRLTTLSQLTLASGITETDVTNRCLHHATATTTTDLLQQAILIAQRIQDRQAESFAIGRLGHVYECQRAYDRALSLTQQAAITAPSPESRYRWEWQAGRIFQAQGKTQQAIAAYQVAVQTLNTLRNDFASAGRDFQFDFRDTVEPVYRELAELQLEQAIAQQTSGISQNRDNPDPVHHKTIDFSPHSAQRTGLLLTSALTTIDHLRLAELQNYLGSDCTLDPVAQSVSLVDARAAVVSSVMLGDRVAIILTLPGQNRILARWLPVSTETVTQVVNQFRLKLERRSDLTNAYQEPAQTLYDWLIRPFATDLQASGVQTLIFIQDGILRSVPMAALHDGKQFLVEQYAIANTLSLTLIEPLPLDHRKLRVLAFGLTQPAAVAGPTFFEPLGQVGQEIQSVLAAIPGSKGLLDADFTLDRLQQEITQTPYPILHLATHGKFGIDARETFLVTGQTRSHADHPSTDDSQPYNATLSLNQLYQIIRNLPRHHALELLTLTACETATGSDRDALGIAGIALQAGARSAIASLWQVDDRATAELITDFYQNLQQGMGRAVALQQAQKAWLRQHSDDKSHPGYWSAMIVVGNWL